jgi:hypothetical protein
VQWVGRRCLLAIYRSCAAGDDGRAATRPYRLGNVPIIIGKWYDTNSQWESVSGAVRTKQKNGGIEVNAPGVFDPLRLGQPRSVLISVLCHIPSSCTPRQVLQFDFIAETAGFAQNGRLT